MCFAAGWNGLEGRIWPAGRSVENPDVLWRGVVTAHTTVRVQHQRWTVMSKLRRHGHNLLNRNTVIWQPAIGTRQAANTVLLQHPPKLFTRNPAIYFTEVDETRVLANVFGMLPGFLEE